MANKKGVPRLLKRQKHWHYRFTIGGKRFSGSCFTASKDRASIIAAEQFQHELKRFEETHEPTIPTYKITIDDARKWIAECAALKSTITGDITQDHSKVLTKPTFIRWWKRSSAEIKDQLKAEFPAYFVFTPYVYPAWCKKYDHRKKR